MGGGRVEGDDCWKGHVLGPERKFFVLPELSCLFVTLAGCFGGGGELWCGPRPLTPLHVINPRR